MRESRESNAIIAIVDDDPSAREGYRPLLLRFNRPRTTIAATLGSCLFYLLLGAAQVHALDPNKRLTQYMHTSWRMQDGSAPSAMVSIAQSSDGFLWFASLPGDIYRFDGVRFVPWLMADRASLRNVVNVVGDRTGGLWALRPREIVHLKGPVITSHLALEGLAENNAIEDPDGSLWVVRTSNSVTDGPLCHVTKGAVKCFGKADGIPISPLDSLLADGNGGFWLGGQTALVHWRAGISQVYPIRALRSNAGQHGIMSLATDADGSLWVGILAEGPGLGLGKLAGGVRPFVTPTFDGSKVVVSKMILDRDHNLWVGTIGKGVFRIDGNNVDHYQHTDGLSSDTVTTIFEDREGIVWVATSNGIDSFRDPRITTFSALEGLGKDSVAGVLAARDRTIWVANSESLDHIVDESVLSIRTGAGLPGHQVTSLLEDRAGSLWVGVDDGLYVFKNGIFRRLPEPNHKPLGMVVGITEDIAGNIWAECLSNPRKLVRIRDFRVQEQYPAAQIPPGHALASDPNGGIWIGTLKGELALFRNGTLQRFPLQLKGNPVSRHIMTEADGSVLASSEDGLIGLRHGQVQRMTTENGLPCNHIISFIEDTEKRWWLYTACGIVELPDSELERWWAKPEAVVHIRLLDALDGAQPNAPSFNAAAYSSDGRVWFANGFVVQVVDSSRLSEKALTAQTYIESVVVDRTAIAATENLKLPPNPRDLQIDYTSPTFAVPQKVEFRYRLDPYDHDWHDAGTRRQAFYTDLPPRRYSFRVMASNGDGVWNESAAKLDFSVASAYYQTNWFRALCAALFLALIWAGYQLRMRHLRRDFKKLQDVIETIPAIVFEVGPDGTGAFGNRRWLEYTGSSLRQYGKFAPEDQAWRDSTCIHPDDLDGYVKLWERAIATGQPFELETRVRRADGEYRWFLARHVPLRDQQGKILKWFGTLTDIEERKRTEETLRESETRFRTFVDHAGDALFVQDLEQGTIIDVNRSACESLGYTREELIGKLPLAFHLDSYQAEMKSIAERAAAGEPVSDRHWHRRKDGSTFPVEVHTNLVSYGGRRFLLKVARDISDRVRAEEQRDKLRELEADLAHINRVSMMGELTASIAHEVNQPLSGVVSNASASLRWLAGDSPNLEEAREAARRIVRDGKRAGEVISRIRALTIKTSTPREKLDLNETLRQVLALVGDEAKRERVNIRTQFADDLSPVSGDQVQLQQVVLNLTMNAIEAMSSVGERPRELLITTRNTDPEQVQVTVEDSGVGIDPQKLNKIFDSFYTTKPGGMGMGLSISRSILQAHGGRLWATAKDGKGTIFHFTLPQYHEEEANAGIARV